MKKNIEMKTCRECGKRFTPQTQDFVFSKDKKDYSIYCPYCGTEVHNSKFTRY